MSKKKMIHIAYSGLGGTTDYVFNLIKGDKANKVEHYILFYGIEDVPKAQLEMAKSLCTTYAIKKEEGIDNKALNKLKDILAKVKADAITLHVNSLIYSIKKYAPKNSHIIFVEHQANHLKSKKEVIFSMLAQRRAAHVVCLTDSYRSELKSKLRVAFNSSKTSVIETGIALEDYAHPYQKESKKIGMISRINQLKDHATLLEAFSQVNMNNWELLIAGDGESLAELKQKYTQSNITFLGYISPVEVRSVLMDLSIYVHATHGETSSLSIMQARAAGLPIIASDVDGVNTVITNKDGVLVEPKNLGAMKMALVNLMNDQSRREELSQLSLHYAKENLSNEKMFNAFLNLMP